MTVFIKIGRRVPRSWAKRTLHKAAGLISFQENIWIIITSSISLAKKKANAAGTVKFIVTKEIENEDLNYQLEWLKIVIQGSKEAEQSEVDDMEKFYLPLNKIMKKDIPKDENFSKHFKTKMLNLETLDKAYKKGYGAIDNDTLANKILEMGILTSIEWIHDHDTREIDLPIDH
jgi:hypothetical protein